MLSLTTKQKEYWTGANRRWNVKCGATRSGKTFLDYYMIPKRIRSLAGKDGLILFLGNTKGTLQRNVIEPMQNIWGTELVGNIRSDNRARLFGEWVYCLGADKVDQVKRIQGAGFKYCYGDEVVTWHRDVFEMLKSRLDKPYSVFDGTCNPDQPRHWFKEFLESDADIFHQHYTIYDNSFLSPDFIANLEREYAGTIFFDRFILGKWTQAEGLIYKVFADNPKAYETTVVPGGEISIGVDFGGNKSNHAFVASMINGATVTALASRSIPAKDVSVEGIVDAFLTFTDYITKKYGRIDYVFADSAEQAIINTLRSRTPYAIRNSIKNKIIDRIRCENVLLNTKRFSYVKGENEALINGLSGAVWNDKILDDQRLDNGTSDIDVMDAFEYSWEYRIKNLLRG